MFQENEGELEVGAKIHNTNVHTLRALFPNLSILANVCLTIPVGTASVERSFSHMKMIKSRLRNRLGEANLSYAMKLHWNPLRHCQMKNSNTL